MSTAKLLDLTGPGVSAFTARAIRPIDLSGRRQSPSPCSPMMLRDHQDSRDRSTGCRGRVTSVTATTGCARHCARGRETISHHQHRRNRMTLPMNDDVANRELSIEELEAIAAGSIWGWIK